MRWRQALDRAVWTAEAKVRVSMITVLGVLLFASASTAQAQDGEPIFMKIDPAATYDLSDAAATNDDAAGPTVVSLVSLSVRPRDILELIRIGEFIPGARDADDTEADPTYLLAVFRGEKGYVKPGDDADPRPIKSPATCPSELPIFPVTGPEPTLAQVPDGATEIVFSASPCLAQNNTDPDGDFGAQVKVLACHKACHGAIR